MGLDISDMGPTYGRVSSSEEVLSRIEDPEVAHLAASLFSGFNSLDNLPRHNANLASTAARAIDALVRARIVEALAVKEPETPEQNES